jgi:hypothetical protein
MADTHTDRQNVLEQASLEEEVASAQDRIYLMDCGAHMVGGKERQMMRRMIVACGSDSLVGQVGNEVGGEVGGEKQRVERLSAEKADCHNHRHLC